MLTIDNTITDRQIFLSRLQVFNNQDRPVPSEMIRNIFFNMPVSGDNANLFSPRMFELLSRLQQSRYNQIIEAIHKYDFRQAGFILFKFLQVGATKAMKPLEFHEWVIFSRLVMCVRLCLLNN